jgi:hypothetical protein
VPVLVTIPLAEMTFVQDQKNRRYQADFSVVARVRDERGTEIDRLSQHYPLGIPSESLEAAKQGEVLFFRETDLAPGRYTVDAVAYDAEGKRASVRTVPLEVPAVKQGGLALSSVAILKRVEQIAAQDMGGDNPLYQGESFMYPNLGEPLRKSVTPAVGFFFTVYSAGAPVAPTRADVEVAREGQVLASLPVTLGAPDGSGRIQHAAALPMERLTPGSYTLKVAVASGAESASQQTQFVVEP